MEKPHLKEMLVLVHILTQDLDPPAHLATENPMFWACFGLWRIKRACVSVPVEESGSLKSGALNERCIGLTQSIR